MDTGDVARSRPSEDGGRRDGEGGHLALDDTRLPDDRGLRRRVAGSLARLDGHRTAGVVLLTLWLTWLVTTMVLQPRTVPLATLQDDLRSGSVTSFRVVLLHHDDDPSWVQDLNLWWIAEPGTSDGQGLGPGYETIAYGTSSTPWTRVVEDAVDPLDPTVASLRAAGVPAGQTFFDAPRIERADWSQWPGLLVGTGFLGVLLLGPRPVRGTRWFWFWFAFPTLGAGVVAYAVAEHLRRPGGLTAADRGRALDVVDAEPPPDRRREPDEQPVHRRRSGLAGFATSILLGFLVSAVLHAVIGASGWTWVVRP